MRNIRTAAILAGIAAALAVANGARADVQISSAATSKMTCSEGVCTPTAKNAVLNVADLESMLASGPVSVSTDGAGVEARDIDVRSPLTWTSANALELAAYRSITIDSAVSVAGGGNLSLYTDNGGKRGALTFGKQGHATFSNLSSTLAINGANYTLVGDIKDLANAIATNAAGNYALAANYNAAPDGTYTATPVSTEFTGNFEGLGNTIQNLTINDSSDAFIGLFAQLQGGRISDIGVIDATVTAPAGDVGALLGRNDGTVTGSYSSGTLFGATGQIGGLIGFVDATGNVDRSHSSASLDIANGNAVVGAGLAGSNYGLIRDSYATGTISNSGTGGYIAGLVSYNGGRISTSFATGDISAGTYGYCGGLVGLNYIDAHGTFIGKVDNSYATGNLTYTDTEAGAGGFAAANESAIMQCYSTGRVDGYFYGGFVVYEAENNISQMDNDYWDTTTSGTTTGVYNGSSQGLTGLTSQQLQSGLPERFSPKIWAEDPKINHGFPYLINNPPH